MCDVCEVIEGLQREALAEIEACRTKDELRLVKARWLGRKGIMPELMRALWPKVADK